MKYVLITGGASGMGRATALKLSKEGYYVFSCDINKNIEEIENIEQIIMDVTDINSIKNAYDKISKITSTLEAIINFAGIIMMNSLIEIDERQYRKIFDVNVLGAYYVNKVFFEMIYKNKGKIIITTSELAGNKILPFNAIYSISKKSLDAYAQGLTMELAFLDIPVITIRPGSIKTPLLDDSSKEMETLNNNTIYYKNTINKFKHIVDKEQGSGVEPEKIANLVYKILNKKKPKHIYSFNSSLKLKLLSILPSKLQVKIFKWILK